MILFGIRVFCIILMGSIGNEGTKMKTYIGDELYENLKEIYFQCYFDYLTSDKRKKIESNLVRLKTLPFKKEIVETTKENLTDDNDIFDNNPYLLGFKNMVYDLQVGEFRKYQRNDFVNITTGYDWVEPTSEELRTMMDLIKSIMPKEAERECYLRILATGLSGVALEKFIILNGVGRNGKGLTNDMYLRALGHYAMIANNAILTEKRRTGANPEIANLHKKRYVVFREPSSKEKFQNAMVKELTGGGSFSARGLFEKETQKTLTMTCVVECNKKPLFAETPQVAEVERVIDILFRNTFTDKEEDVNPEFGVYRGNAKFKELTFQLQHCCAFLKIVMDSYKRYAQDNCSLKIPKSVKERSNDYLEQSCDLYQWIMDNYEKSDNPKDVVKMKDMYNTFKGSDFYDNLTRADKRSSKYSEKGFILQITENVFLRKYYFDRKNIQGTYYRSVLCGFKEKENIQNDIIVVEEE